MSAGNRYSGQSLARSATSERGGADLGDAGKSIRVFELRVYDRFAAQGLLNLPTAWSQGRTTRTARLDRAVELADRKPWAKQVLSFYARILVFQNAVYERTRVENRLAVMNVPVLSAALDLDRAAQELPEFAEIVSTQGPSFLAQYAKHLRRGTYQQARDALERWLLTPERSDSGSAFFARVLLQPQAERLVEAGIFQPQRRTGNRCPCCESNPQLAIIRPEGDGGKRSLLCSFCMWEWEFRRILCPACGEENHEKLPRYSAEEIAAVRIEACDGCKHYLKSVDLTVDGLAVPVVDEIATAALDLWAAERNYRKIQLNIVGF
jgi:FdhE protein